MLLPSIMAAYRGGDNHLLSGVSRIVEGQGFRLLGAHEVAPEILVPEGALGRINASEQHRQDITLGFDCAPAVRSTSGKLWWWSQARARGKAEKELMPCSRAWTRANGRAKHRVALAFGESPKARPPLDLPSIGPQTSGAPRSGIAVVAGSTIVAEAEQLVAAADRAKIFVVGVPSGTQQ
jgi:DUF1009 family protein